MFALSPDNSVFVSVGNVADNVMKYESVNAANGVGKIDFNSPWTSYSCGEIK